MTAKLLAKASLSSTASSSRLQSRQNEFPLPPCDPGRSGQFRQCFDTKQDRRNHHHRLLVSLFNEPLCSSEPIGFWSLVKLESFLQSSSNPCFKDYFRCTDGKQSIFSCFVCDVQVDCQDGSDEKLSLCRPPKPKENDPLPEGGQYDNEAIIFLILWMIFICSYAVMQVSVWISRRLCLHQLSPSENTQNIWNTQMIPFFVLTCAEGHTSEWRESLRVRKSHCRSWGYREEPTSERPGGQQLPHLVSKYRMVGTSNLEERSLSSQFPNIFKANSLINCFSLSHL